MHDFTKLIDLAQERLGARILVANDEFFAAKENLLKPGRGVFIEDKYTDRGKWMDGWETRRRRTPGHDWCILALGLPGVIRGLNIDTNHFRGNAPQSCSVDACELPAETNADELIADNAHWKPLLPESPVDPHAENHFPIESDARWTHLRLNIHPDGGVARFRVHGYAAPDLDKLRAATEDINLLAAENGARPISCSDEFFSSPRNLLMPGRAKNMGDGWETKRRRGPGHDWAILALGVRGVANALLIDTNHFKGNYPDSFSLEACDCPSLDPHAPPPDDAQWRTLIEQTKLNAHEEHRFESLDNAAEPMTHVRLNIYPDGGVSRLRLYGKPVSP